MKYLTHPAFRILLTVIILIGFAASVSAFFWEKEPEPTLDEIYISLTTSSDSVAESFKDVLSNEFKVAADLAARDAKHYYNENLEEDEALKSKWNDRDGDYQRLQKMEGRDLIGLVQWAMFEKERQAAEEAEKEEVEPVGKQAGDELPL